MFLVSALLLLAPMLGEVLGAAEGDTYKHVWSFWHTKETLGRNWPWTDLLSAPHGGILLDVMLAPSLVFLPITWLCGASISSQIFVVVSFWLLGVSVFALSRYLQLSRNHACAAGILAQTAPYLFGYPLVSGVYERLSLWVFPFLWLCFLRYQQERRYSILFFATLSLLYLVFSCQNYAVFSIMMIGFGFLISRTRASIIFTFVMVGTVFVAFLYIRYLHQSSWTLAPQPMRLSFLPTGPIVEESASLSDLFSPFSSRENRGVESGDWLIRICYVGWLPVILCIWGYRNIPRDILFLAVSFVVLALGTEVYDGVVNLPYWLLAYVLPLYGSIPDTFQHIAIAIPFLAIAMIFSMRSLRPRMQVFLFAMVVLERWFALPHNVLWRSSTDQIPDIYTHVQDGPLVELPRQWKGRQLVSAEPFLYQTLHKQPLAISVYMGVTAWDAYAPIAIGSSSDWMEAFACMRKGGIRWVMVHTEWFAHKEQGLETIEKIALEPYFFDGERYLFDLSALNISPLSNVFLPPRNTQYQEDFVDNPDIPLSLDIFAMVQYKCPIDSAAQHRLGP